MRTLSLDTIQELLRRSKPQRLALQKAYALIPQTRCRRKTLCCSMLPEMALIEAISVIQKMIAMTPARRRRFTHQIVRYFFLNAVQITPCPFLDGQDCSIYPDRFHGCRSYGLWSAKYYRKLVQQNQLAKKQLQSQWRHLGVNLPQAVIDFQAPYCLDVATIDGKKADDSSLRKVSDTVESLSRQFPAAHQEFQQTYFSDLSFLTAALIFGFTEAVQLKFAVVKEIIHTGRRKKLNTIMRECPDMFADCASADGKKSLKGFSKKFNALMR